MWLTHGPCETVSTFSILLLLRRQTLLTPYTGSWAQPNLLRRYRFADWLFSRLRELA
ncbi:hypothetical protein AMTRI_Chr06g173460 [Amborella trichopoda]